MPSIGQAVSKPKGAARGKKEARGINGTAVSLVGLVILFAGWSLAVRYLDVPPTSCPRRRRCGTRSGRASPSTRPASLGHYLPL